MLSNRLIAAGRGLAATVLLTVPASASTYEKIDPWVFSELARSPAAEAEFLIVLAEQADLGPARGLATKLEKGRYVFATLSTLAAASQAPLLDELAAAGLPHRPFWIVNMVWAKGNAAAVISLAARSDVARIAANPRVRGHVPAEADPLEVLDSISPEAVEGNISHVNADDVWALGFTGQGVVVGGQDTGYRWSHDALKGKYRGWNGTTADHNFNWHDAIHSGGGVCGANTVVPCDDHSLGHGTHTMGTMVGDDGGTNQIGMAPGAKWIGCRNMNVGDGTPATYSECWQWFLAPTDLSNSNPNPDLAPHVINNSWGCPTSEGCDLGASQAMEIVVDNIRSAGIVPVVSAGNTGSGCSSVSTPGAIYDSSFTVGNTEDPSDRLAPGSSRGPVTALGFSGRKPDISAPGTSVRSCNKTSDSSYASLTGTSMAGPHVAGLVALLISARPELAGQVDALEELIRESAFTGVIVDSGASTCGSIPAATIPNNHFGWGRIDALAAVQLLQSGFLFRDGFETGATDDWSRIGFEDS